MAPQVSLALRARSADQAPAALPGGASALGMAAPSAVAMVVLLIRSAVGWRRRLGLLHRHRGRHGMLGVFGRRHLQIHSDRQPPHGTCQLRRHRSPEGGSLMAQGVVEISFAGIPRPADLAITGGTGKYVGARGTLHLRDATSHEIFKITLR